MLSSLRTLNPSTTIRLLSTNTANPIKSKPFLAPLSRSHYPVFVDIPTRWADNDQYGHVNNVIYLSFFDTAINNFLIANNLLDPSGTNPLLVDNPIGFCVESQCKYYKPISYPEIISVGIGVENIGRSSCKWSVGIFKKRGGDGDNVEVEGVEEDAAAFGHFVHVFVERESKKKAVIPANVREKLEEIMVGSKKQ